MKKYLKKMEHLQQTSFFFEILKNSGNYIFGIKKKAAFRYADRKKTKKQLRNPDFFSGPPDRTGHPDRASSPAAPRPLSRPLRHLATHRQTSGWVASKGRPRYLDGSPLKVAVEGRR